MITVGQIKERVTRAVRMVRVRDGFLLEYAVHERSITHKLAEYLQQEFPDYNVDCEYNKYEQATKTLLRKCNEVVHELVYPDIVVHLRGSKFSNLLVVEAKPDKHFDPQGCDAVKLSEFTKLGNYHYQLGLFIGFNGLDEPNLVWFEDGRESS